MKRVIAVFFLSLTSSFAYAGDLTACAEIATDAKRLACYDAAQPPSILNKIPSKWVVSTSQSPVDDSKSVVAMLDSETTFKAPYSDQMVSATMTIRCQENATDMLFFFGEKFMSDNEQWGEVVMRLDKLPAQTFRMSVSTSNKTLGLWSGEGVSFLKSMEKADSLFVRAVPYNENPLSLTFRLAGIKDAISDVRKNCNW